MAGGAPFANISALSLLNTKGVGYENSGYQHKNESHQPLFYSCVLRWNASEQKVF